MTGTAGVFLSVAHTLKEMDGYPNVTFLQERNDRWLKDYIATGIWTRPFVVYTLCDIPEPPEWTVQVDDDGFFL